MATRKAKRYDDGGMTDEEVKSFAGTPDNDSNAGMATTDEPVATPTPRKQSFGEAFAAARKGGEKTFEWNGKKYGTAMASDSKTTSKTSSTGADYGNEGRRPIRAATTTRNILEEAKEEARRRRAGAEAMAPKREAPGRFAGKGPGLGALSNMKKGGAVKSSASSRADGIASKGKTRGKIC